jgi:hypothetical protein
MRLSRAVLIPLTSLVVVGAHLSLPGIGSVATADASTITIEQPDRP